MSPGAGGSRPRLGVGSSRRRGALIYSKGNTVYSDRMSVLGVAYVVLMSLLVIIVGWFWMALKSSQK